MHWIYYNDEFCDKGDFPWIVNLNNANILAGQSS